MYGARGAHIANTLLTDSEYIHFFLLWAMAAGVLIGVTKAMRAYIEAKALVKETKPDSPTSVKSEDSTVTLDRYSELQGTMSPTI